MARFPQFYSRIGFVHEFRPLAAAKVHSLLEGGWAPSGDVLPDALLSPEVLAAIVRMTGGNFRLLNRLLTRSSGYYRSTRLRPSPSRSSTQHAKASSSVKHSGGRGSPAYDTYR